jgi:cation:H+ antiporter
MNITTALLAITISSIAIYFSSSRFATSSSRLGDHLRLPRDVKGATFDAVSSSLPEFLVALFSVIIFKEFEVGIGTIAGSALFNLLIIPGICVLIAPTAFKVSKNVISRDAMFYLITVFVLVILLVHFQTWGLVIAIILLAVYAFYLKDIIKHTNIHKKTAKKIANDNIKREIWLALINLAIIGAFTYLLTKASITLSELLQVPAIIIAFTITAAATSVPDTIISAVNARKGDIDDAASNIFGSNIFDISIGLGLPLLIYTLIKGAVIIDFANIEIIFGLLGATILVLYFFADTHTLTKKQAITLLIMYSIFVIYVISLATWP